MTKILLRLGKALDSHKVVLVRAERFIRLEQGQTTGIAVQTEILRFKRPVK